MSISFSQSVKSMVFYKVIGGQVIGTANSSHCEDHIHLSFKKVGASYVDPTRFLEKAYPTLPTWVQQCDDYKLVFKVRENRHCSYTA